MERSIHDSDEWASTSVAEFNELCRQRGSGSSGGHAVAVRCAVAESKGRVLISEAAFRPGALIFRDPPCHIVGIQRENAAYILVSTLCDAFSAASFVAERGTGASPPPPWALWCALNSLTREDLATASDEACATNRTDMACVADETQRKLLCLCHSEVDTPGDTTCAALTALGLAPSSRSGAGVDAVAHPRLVALGRKVEQLSQVWMLNSFFLSHTPPERYVVCF